MPRLLINEDYLKYIQEKNLLQIVEDNYTIAHDVEQVAQQEIAGYLKQRYITTEVFTNTGSFDLSAVYYGKNLIYFHPTPFNETTTYALDDVMSRNGLVYQAPGAISAGPFNVTDWTERCSDGLFFYITLPEDEFDIDTTYEIDDVVWWQDTTYTARVKMSGILPSNSSFWTEGAEYSVTGEYPWNDSIWTQGDNRNPLIIMWMLDITLHHLHKRLNYRNFPVERKEAYDGNSPAQIGGAIGRLKQIARGEFNIDLPQVLPVQNLEINWGNSGGAATFKSNTY